MAVKSRFGPELTEAEISMEELLILEFLIKQLFYSGLAEYKMIITNSALSITSYPARPRRIVVN